LQAIRRYADADHEAVRALFVRVNRELAPAHLKDAFERYIARSLHEEIDRLPAYYGEPRGSFWVATGQPEIVGMFGLERADQATAELRRMYVDPDARRQGVGRSMLAFAEDGRMPAHGIEHIRTAAGRNRALSRLRISTCPRRDHRGAVQQDRRRRDSTLLF
jgi:GNAT superfamily N-acetyltransferase